MARITSYVVVSQIALGQDGKVMLNGIDLSVFQTMAKAKQQTPYPSYIIILGQAGISPSLLP